MINEWLAAGIAVLTWLLGYSAGWVSQRRRFDRAYRDGYRSGQMAAEASYKLRQQRRLWQSVVDRKEKP